MWGDQKHTRNAQLVQRAQGGDKEAFGELYELYFDRIYYLALRQLDATERAQDAAQEVFLKALLKIDTLKNPQAFERWLYRIAHTVIADARLGTTQQRDQEYDLDDARLDEVPADEPDEPEEEFLSEKLLDAGVEQRFVRFLLDTLTDAQREVVLLYYFAGLKPRDIAPVLNVAPATVSKRLHDARRALQKQAEAFAADQTPQANKQQGAAPVLAQLFQLDLNGVALDDERELTAAHIAALLPTALMLNKTPAAAARAQFFLDKAKPAKAAASAPSALKTVVLIAAAAVLTAGLASGAYALYRRNTATPQSAQTQTTTSTQTPQESAPTDAQQPTATQPQPQQQPQDPTPFSVPVATSALAQTTSATDPLDPTLQVARPKLSYATGTPLTPQQILADAGVSVRTAQGIAATITASRAASLDPKLPGTSAIFIHATDASGRSSNTKTIWITCQ